MDAGPEAAHRDGGHCRGEDARRQQGRRIDKGKPAQNGKVERFHRTVDDEFYSRYCFQDKDDLIRKFREYLVYYNHEREHLSLNGLTPLEKLRTYNFEKNRYHLDVKVIDEKEGMCVTLFL